MLEPDATLGAQDRRGHGPAKQVRVSPQIVSGHATAEAPTSMPGMDHGTSMPGMGTEEMDMLKQAKDADFDKTFLEMMTEHHQGAIDMSKTELQQGSNADAKKLAQQIIDSQQAEITEMQGMLAAG